MRDRSWRRILPVAAVLVWGCGGGGNDSADVDSGPDRVSIYAFIGTWHASTDLYTNRADPDEQYEVIANGGEARMTVLSGGGARTWLTIGDFDDEWDAQLTVDGNTLTSTPVETTRPVIAYEFTLDGDDLRLTTDDGEFDFTMSGATPVPANVYVEMTRN